METERAQAGRSGALFKALYAAFAVQIAGRVVDLQWHRTNPGFETGADQLRAHWLVWLGTVLVLGVAIRALRAGLSRGERRGYRIALVANLLYAVVAVIHFIQHLNHQEVDWAHFALVATNVASVVGVLMVTATRLRRPQRATG